jgi:hypothetical protein
MGAWKKKMSRNLISLPTYALPGCRRTIPATIFSHLWLSFLLLAVNRTLLKVVIMQIFVKTLTGEYSNIVFCFILLASNRRKLMLPSTFSSLPSMTLSLSTMKRSCQ